MGGDILEKMVGWKGKGAKRIGKRREWRTGWTSERRSGKKIDSLERRERTFGPRYRTKVEKLRHCRKVGKTGKLRNGGEKDTKMKPRNYTVSNKRSV